MKIDYEAYEAESMSLTLLFNAAPGWAAVKNWQRQKRRGHRRRYSRRQRA